jgi:2-polyprenyl-3-methyl-5-hydroxy-6-metoxy-1,4-benzoquinol methylase
LANTGHLFAAVMSDWWQTFFDSDYLRLWEGSQAPDRTEREAAGLWTLLKLREGSSVLDAPCGYGRISLALAKRGANVVGLDFSAELLAEAERRRGEVATDRLRYRRVDLREPLSESGFDVALNVFSSLGYGEESEDIAILSNLRAAVRPDGHVFVETAHRDGFMVMQAHGQHFGNRLADGTILLEQPHLNPVSGRIDASWYWSGPAGSGQKSSSLRVYSVTELVRLLPVAGLQLCSLHNGCSAEPYVASGRAMSWRLGILAIRR